MKKQIQILHLLEKKLSLGINIYQGIRVKSQEKLQDVIKSELKVIKEAFSQELTPGYQYSRKLYRAFSIDPTKHRPSSEALWRRLKRGFDFPVVNPIVDLSNLLSLKFQVCFGLYDLDKIKNQVTVCLGENEDTYQGIRKDMVHLKGKIMLKDVDGPFGNPSSDSLRASTDGTTTSMLQVLFFFIEDPQKQQHLEETQKYYTELFMIDETSSYII